MIFLPKKPHYIKFAEDLDFFELFQKINANFDTCFLLESLGPQSEFSRYSIIGFEPDAILDQTSVGKCHPERLVRRSFGEGGSEGSLPSKQEILRSAQNDNPYNALKKSIPQDIISRAYSGGLIGYLGFDCVNYFEPALNVKTDDRFPSFMFGVYVYFNPLISDGNKILG